MIRCFKYYFKRFYKFWKTSCVIQCSTVRICYRSSVSIRITLSQTTDVDSVEFYCYVHKSLIGRRSDIGNKEEIVHLLRSCFGKLTVEAL